MASKHKDLLGKRFGRLVVTTKEPIRKWRSYLWGCTCDCGTTKFVYASTLIQGTTRSCGCLRRVVAGRKRLDLRGHRFGKLFVVEVTDIRRGSAVVWKCKCDCGRETLVGAGQLTLGLTKSCGCYRRDKAREKAIHGMADTPEYRAWIAMRRRCQIPTEQNYGNYGGRGITVCDEWSKSFVDFYAHVGSRPSPEHSLHRINNDGNYEPGNVKWGTSQEQQNARRCTIYLTLDGQRRTAMEWSRHLGVSHHVITNRAWRYTTTAEFLKSCRKRIA
jgi:hypothetical protein